ncbi:MAG: hypothetical protein JNK72_01915 [Myxococcales bacterium]|nr:hypothetical protein [Myxococcales bacterium]
MSTMRETERGFRWQLESPAAARGVGAFMALGGLTVALGGAAVWGREPIVGGVATAMGLGAAALGLVAMTFRRTLSLEDGRYRSTTSALVTLSDREAGLANATAFVLTRKFVTLGHRMNRRPYPWVDLSIATPEGHLTLFGALESPETVAELHAVTQRLQRRIGLAALDQRAHGEVLRARYLAQKFKGWALGLVLSGVIIAVVLALSAAGVLGTNPNPQGLGDAPGRHRSRRF